MASGSVGLSNWSVLPLRFCCAIRYQEHTKNVRHIQKTWREWQTVRQHNHTHLLFEGKVIVGEDSMNTHTHAHTITYTQQNNAKKNKCKATISFYTRTYPASLRCPKTLWVCVVCMCVWMCVELECGWTFRTCRVWKLAWLLFRLLPSASLCCRCCWVLLLHQLFCHVSFGPNTNKPAHRHMRAHRHTYTHTHKLFLIGQYIWICGFYFCVCFIHFQF